MNEAAAALLGEAAVLHDIGKLAIPDAILKKPGPLTPEEFAVMKTHPVLGAQILRESRNPVIQLAHEVCLHHHERWDGNGYPHGLRGDACSLEARIVGIVDVYDALTEKRVYKEVWPSDRVLSFFEEHAGTAFDPQLVGLLISDFDQFETIRLAADDSTVGKLPHLIPAGREIPAAMTV
jgi:putative two-component system response regulator